MDWFWIVLIGLAIFGGLSRAAETEKKKKEAVAEAALRKERAEAARAAILASGNKEAIGRLHLMEASYLASAGQPVQAGSQGAGAGILGTAAAVAGGMVVGNAVSGAIQAAQIDAAFADLQANLASADPTSLASVDLDMSGGGGDDLDFDLEI